MTWKELWTWLRQEDAGAWLSRFVTARKGLLIAAVIWLASAWGGVSLAIHMPRGLASALGLGSVSPQLAQQIARRDPRPGHVYLLPPVYDLEGRSQRLPKPGHPTCLLFAYQCGACEVDQRIVQVQRLVRTVPNLEAAVVVVHGDSQRVRAHWRGNRLTLPVFIDSTGEAARKLNAILSIRAYLFDKQRRLLWLSHYGQKPGTTERRLRYFARTGL